MTTGFAIKVLFEIGAILLIAYGYKNEDKLIEFETELTAVLKFAFKKYVLKQTKNTNRTKQNKMENKEQRSNRVQATTGSQAARRAVIKKFPVTERHNNVA